MNRKSYLVLFILALGFLSLNFYFQKTAGYLDAQYYFLGGKTIASGTFSAPVIWNYLDDPASLPHPLFTYWMPLPSILTAIPLWLLQSNSFLTGRLLFWLLASLIPPFTAWITYRWTENGFSAWIAGFLAIFNGLYFKFLTLPETVTIYILLGGFFFYVAYSVIRSPQRGAPPVLMFSLGLSAALLHLTRVDGIIFLLIGILVASYPFPGKKRTLRREYKFYLLNVGLLVFGYFLIMGIWYVRTYSLFGSFFSPASSRALWITEYNDTFSYPATSLIWQHWLQYGLPDKLTQIWTAAKLNAGNLVAVQLGLVGVPLAVWSLIRHKKSPRLLFPGIYFLLIFGLMTIIFSLAGARGGYLHAMAAIQIYFWFLIADGLNHFIAWGIAKRDWKLIRSQWMFGSALIVFSILLTGLFYYRDVIQPGDTISKWDAEHFEFQLIESAISEDSQKNMVILINNPVGYNLASNRWSIAIPNANWQDLNVLIEQFNVRYIVLDDNLPVQLVNKDRWVTSFQLVPVLKTESGKQLYELP